MEKMPGNTPRDPGPVSSVVQRSFVGHLRIKSPIYNKLIYSKYSKEEMYRENWIWNIVSQSGLLSGLLSLSLSISFPTGCFWYIHCKHICTCTSIFTFTDCTWFSTHDTPSSAAVNYVSRPSACAPLFGRWFVTDWAWGRRNLIRKTAEKNCSFPQVAGTWGNRVTGLFYKPYVPAYESLCACCMAYTHVYNIRYIYLCVCVCVGVCGDFT